MDPISRTTGARWLDRIAPSAKRTGKFWQRLAMAGLVLASVAGTAPTSTGEAAPPPNVLPELNNDVAKNPSGTYRLLIQRLNNDTSVDSYVTGTLGGKKLKDVAGGAFVAQLSGSKLASLASYKSTKFVTYDAKMQNTATVDPSQLANIYDGAVNATQEWTSGTGITGKGVGVAVLDTGVSTTQPDFGGRFVDNNFFSSGTTNDSDYNGHGTLVASVIGGNSWLRQNSSDTGKYVGIAPEANLLDVKVSDDNGMSYLSDVVNAIDWVISVRQNYNIRVMNLSFVSSVAESYTTSLLDAAVEKAWLNGIFVVCAAGNSGANTMQYPPANDPFVVSVGAADPMGTVDRTDDGMAPWSSYGTTQDGFAKPEVVAPGRYITGVLTNATSKSYLATNFPTHVVDSNYIWMSGTSLSAPIVSGIAALAFQAHPGWTNDQLKWVLENTAGLLTGGGATAQQQGYGEVDAQAAAGYSAAPGSANQGLTISSQLVGPSGSTVYNSSSSSTSSWSTSSWSTASWSTSCWTSSSWTTANSTTSNFVTSTWDGEPTA